MDEAWQRGINQKVGANLRQCRKLRKLSREQLAQLAGVSAITIYQYERGEVAVSVARLVVLGKWLKVPILALLDGVEEFVNTPSEN